MAANGYVSAYEEMRQRAKQDELSALNMLRAQWVKDHPHAAPQELLGYKPTDDDVMSVIGLAGRWMREFDAYNATINNSLGILAEQPQDIQGRDSEMNLLQAVLERPITPVAALIAPAGAGKALANDTLIPVNDDRGYVAIGDLKVGDVVFDDLGHPTRVLGVFPQGMKQAYKVTVGTGESFVVNDEHLWNVRTATQHKKNRPYSTWTTRQMIDYGVHGKPNHGHGKPENRLFIPMNGAVERLDRTLPLHPYALGALIGDGCLTVVPDHGNPLKMSSNDREVVERVAALIGASGIVRNDANFNWMFTDPAPARPGAKYIQLARFLDVEELSCVFGKKSVERRIPKAYLLGSIEQRTELLRGLLDTDGHISDDDRVRVSFATNSEGLASDVRELAASLGIATTLRAVVRHDDLHKNVEYTVAFKMPDGEKEHWFHLRRHIEKIRRNARTNKRFHRHYDDAPVRDIEDLGYECEMTCIYVDSPSHLFLCGRSHTVTHNTALVEEFVKQSNSGQLDNELGTRYMLFALRLGEISALESGELQSALAQILPQLKYFEDMAQLALGDPNLHIVLFIDEVHMLVTIFGPGTKIGGDIMKDMLARSPIRVIAATTRREYDSTIAVDKPLAERFKTIELRELGTPIVKKIIYNWWERVAQEDIEYPPCPDLDDDVVNYVLAANKAYRPDSAEPRKSLDILEDLVSWCRRTGEPATRQVVEDVFHDRFAISLGFNVDADKIMTEMNKRIVGQAHAKRVWDLLLHATAFKSKQNDDKPIFTSLLTGPTGVGKTASTKAIADTLYPGEHVLQMINMPDYSLDEQEPLFRKELGEILRHTPNAVILFDEFEKAAPNIRRSMLQILDEGIVNFTVTNREGRDETNKASLRDAIVICTTNAGANVFADDQRFNRRAQSGRGVDENDYVAQADIDALLVNLKKNLQDNGFPPEMLGRFDQIIPYRALSVTASLTILERQLRALLDDLRDMHDLDIKLHDPVQWDASQYDCVATDVAVFVAFQLAKIDDSNSGGARNLARELESAVFYRIVQATMQYPDCKTFELRVDGAYYKEDVKTGEKTWLLNTELKGGVVVEPVYDENEEDVAE